MSTIHKFTSGEGGSPTASLLQGHDGNFYGTTPNGGTLGFGTAFKITPAGTVTTLVSFDSTNVGILKSALVEDGAGNFYGTSSGQGYYSFGTVFKITPANKLITLTTFDGSNGSTPSGALAPSKSGAFYGTTSGLFSNEGLGTLFKITPAGKLTTLESFNGSDGATPGAGLILGSDGNFYGTTLFGGANDLGTVFRLTPAGKLTTLVSFDSIGGNQPTAGLVQGSDGNFYGTNSEGGPKGCGDIFRITPGGALTEVAYFNCTDGRGDGYLVQGALIQATDGNFYGTTYDGGGTYHDGTVFRVTPAGQLTTIATFNGTNGAHPIGGLVQGSDGGLYGSTSAGGAGYGTIFKLTLN